MQALSKAALRLLALLQREADDAGVGVDIAPGVMMYDGDRDRRQIPDGGGYDVGDWDKRPDFIKDQTAGWDLLVTLSDRSTGRNARS